MPGSPGPFDPRDVVGWDEWFDTFDVRKLNFLYQEERKDGNQSNFFRLESPDVASSGLSPPPTLNAACALAHGQPRHCTGHRLLLGPVVPGRCSARRSIVTFRAFPATSLVPTDAELLAGGDDCTDDASVRVLLGPAATVAVR